MSKYHAVPTEVDNIRFASRMEARRYVQLRTLERAGVIRNLELQPRFPIAVNGHAICTYISDFRYEVLLQGLLAGEYAVVVEDVKTPGTTTPVYRLKKKLTEALYGIEIVEVQA